MKLHRTIQILLVYLFLTSGSTGNKKPDFSYNTIGNISNYFESVEELLAFFDFKNGDVIAEVGAHTGRNIGGLALLVDSVTFYVQDINAKKLNQRNFNKVLKRCRKHKTILTCTFNLCIGNEKATLLPASAFDKIFLSATFHEFSFIDEMLADIHSKLKPGGKLYILESVCGFKGHKNYTSDQAMAYAKKANFRLVKKDGKDIKGSKGLYRLIFVK